MSRSGVLVAVIGVVIASVAAYALVMRPALDTPERRVAAYLAATSSGDEKRALDAWVIFVGGIHPRPELLARRTELTRELAQLRVGQSYQVRSVDWWRTCCEPGRIDGPGNAGLARMHVTAVDAAGQKHDLVFEVFVKKLAWWGDAAGETVRDWTLYEVHREYEPCIFPTSAYGC